MYNSQYDKCKRFIEMYNQRKQTLNKFVFILHLSTDQDIHFGGTLSGI